MLSDTRCQTLAEPKSGAVFVFLDLNPHREHVFQVVQMGDDYYLVEVILDRADDVQYALPPGGVLGAESLVNEQGRQGLI